MKKRGAPETRSTLLNPGDICGHSTVGAIDRVRLLTSRDRLKNIQLVKIQPRSSDKFNFEFTPIVEEF